MALQIQCPNTDCGQKLIVPDTFQGKTARCKRCGHRFTLSASQDGSRNREVVRTAMPAGKTGVQAPTGATPSSAAVQSSRPSLPTDLPPQIGRFQVRARLGAGAFGTVYRAYDPQLDREVALKVPQPGALENPQAVERFLREAKAAAQLRHPHIVPIFDAGRDGAHPYIASAFIEGHTMASALESGPPDFKTAARIVRALAEALAYAHGKGIVHRDVKPANVMLDAKGEPHLMDFGLAHRGDSADKLTQDGTVLGTPAYMAPEQARGQTGDARPASDQYSLGVILYELLCGQTPFAGPPQVVLFNAIHTEPKAPRSLKHAIPLDLETVCLKAMAKREEDRYVSCQELADDLRRWLEGEPITARRMGLFERAVRLARRRPAVAVAYSLLLVTMVLMSAGAVVVRFWRQAEGARQQAEESRQQAEGARQVAEKAQQDITEVRDRLVVALSDLEQETKLKQDADARAAAAREELLRTTQRIRYTRNIEVAQRAWEANDLVRAEAVLDDCPTELQHWEWWHLKDCCRRKMVTLKGHTSGVSDVSFSSDNQRLASASEDGTVRVWDIRTGQETRVLQGHTDWVTSVAFSPDGQRLVSASRDTTVKVWEANSGQELLTLKGHLNGVNDVAFSPDGTRLATASVKGDGVYLWDGTPQK